MTKSRYKNKKLEVNFIESDFEELKQLAAEENITMSELVRRLVKSAAYDKSQRNRYNTNENRCSETQAKYLDSLLSAV